MSHCYIVKIINSVVDKKCMSKNDFRSLVMKWLFFTHCSDKRWKFKNRSDDPGSNLHLSTNYPNQVQDSWTIAYREVVFELLQAFCHHVESPMWCFGRNHSPSVAPAKYGRVTLKLRSDSKILVLFTNYSKPSVKKTCAQTNQRRDTNLVIGIILLLRGKSLARTPIHEEPHRGAVVGLLHRNAEVGI